MIRLLNGRIILILILLLLVAVITLICLAIFSGENQAEWITAAVATAALTLSLGALKQTAKSADAETRSLLLAEAQERRKRNGWAISPRPDGQAYELRNTGTVSAEHVRLTGGFSILSFAGRTDNDEPVNIAAGEARNFYAVSSWNQDSQEIVVTWKPAGGEETTWIDVVPPLPDRAAESRQERSDQRIREEQFRRENTRDYRDLMLRLGDAFAEWKTDRASAAKKLKVQLLVAALPPQFAREIGFQVDVARDVWGPYEYPLSEHVSPEDRHLIADIEAELELIWNMRTLAGYRVYTHDGAESRETEPRIWWAMLGYAERVHERESGERKLRHSPFDEQQEREARAAIEGLKARTSRRSGGAPEETNDGEDGDDVSTVERPTDGTIE